MTRAVEALTDLFTDRDLRRIAEDRAFALRLHEQGIERRVQAAWREGFAQGFKQGFKEGFKQGRMETRAPAQRIFKRIVTTRFGAVPAEVQARVEGASPEDLERWIDRALDASSLDDVFA